MNEDAVCWLFDEFVKQWITLYYWPYFLAGNIDSFMGAGVTLNGIRPIKC